MRRITDRAIWVVYISILSLGIAYGVAISRLGLYLENRGFSKPEVGDLAIWFAFGIAATAIPSDKLIRRFGPKAMLVAGLTAYAVTVATFPFMTTPTLVGLSRFLDGAFSVVVWVSSETILLARAPRKDKAFYTSIYAISLALGYVIGPVIAWGMTHFVDAKICFHVAGAIAGLTALFVVITMPKGIQLETEENANEPSGDAPAKAESLSTGEIFSRIKTSCFATFSYGYFQASIVLFMPAYAMEMKGMRESETILAPAFFAGGMLLLSNYAARLGDRYGHLFMMRVLGIIGLAAILILLPSHGAIALFVLIFIAGASLASVSPVSLALQGLVIPPRDMSRAGGLYNASYGLGMLVGPRISAEIYSRFGGDAMVVQFGVLWVVFVVFTIAYRRDDPRVRAHVISPAA
jgi:MFS family permease